MQKLSLAAFIGLTGLVCMLIGCESVPKATSLTTPITIFKHYHGNDSGLPAHSVELINSQDELEQIGSVELINKDVDFSHVSLVVLSLGQSPTDGYETCISSVQIRSGELYVQGIAIQPGSDEVITEALTYPYCAVEIEKVYSDTVHPEID